MSALTYLNLNFCTKITDAGLKELAYALVSPHLAPSSELDNCDDEITADAGLKDLLSPCRRRAHIQ